MSSPDPTRAQARQVLQTLCNCILPLLQSNGRQNGVDPKNILFRVEADEFLIELEKLIAGMISRSQESSHHQDIAIEATLSKDLPHHTEAIPEDEATIGGGPGASDNRNPTHVPTNQSMVQYHTVPRSIAIGANEEVLGKKLQVLRRYVTQKLPIRLLYFEPHNSKLKITLSERGEIYNRLALKFRADFCKAPIFLVGLWISQNAGYAILSHTWTQTPGELTYGDWQKGSLDDTQPKCRKLVNFCKAAWNDHGLTLGWIDTVCINKESSAELDESIRSMYAWYHDAEVCITYLAESETRREMHDDPWFTRGWTLQELVAPYHIKFYGVNWVQLSERPLNSDDKEDPEIQTEIELATTITSDELHNIQGTSISRRMQLASKRQVTRGEDIAYCLMGIFDASISTAYGEGTEHAFFRLVEEIFRSSKDISDIFNWAGDREPFSRQPTTSLFPSRPSDYDSRSSNEQLRPWRPIEPLTLTHLGLRTPILLMSVVPIYRPVSLLYQGPPPIGHYHATVSVSPCPFSLNGTRVIPPESYHLLYKSFDDPASTLEVNVPLSSKKTMKIGLAFGTLNVEEQGTSICVPKTCLALLLLRREKEVEAASTDYQKVYTEKPVVFDLKTTGNTTDDEHKHYYQIERNELAKHGMKLVTLIL